MYPSVLDQVGVSKTEPGDDNNQDISALVGKVEHPHAGGFLPG